MLLDRSARLMPVDCILALGVHGYSRHDCVAGASLEQFTL
jgi:hypothetical protein